ncbi:GNAT family N-acetyltransferase [Aestuariibius sp. 2305UL40-4]|uniref:GNAT family N-acetyltransferase n=1 Tax=Aestuariibius violaceus TaxID=3234132 RepID=UPI00345F02CE
MTAPVLETERLILRRPDDRDTDAAIAFLTGERSRSVGGPLSLGQAWRAHAKMVGHWTLRGFGLFAVTEKETGRTLGISGPYYPADWPEKELGWHIWDAASEGKGIAYEAALAARRWAYGDLGWPTAVSYIDPSNARSIALAERLGARLDTAAERPDDECVVYRHPGPEGLQ